MVVFRACLFFRCLYSIYSERERKKERERERERGRERSKKRCMRAWMHVSGTWQLRVQERRKHEVSERLYVSNVCGIRRSDGVGLANQREVESKEGSATY